MAKQRKISLKLSVEAVANLAVALPTLIHMVPFSGRGEHAAFLEMREELRRLGIEVAQTEPYQDGDD